MAEQTTHRDPAEKRKPRTNRVARIAAGWWIVTVVLVLVGGRWLVVVAQRPAHQRQIISELSSLGYLLLPEGPQPDPSGSRLAYAQTTENGAGLFLMDTTSGQQQLVAEDADINIPQNFFGPWAWSPDGARLAYFRWLKNERPTEEQRAIWKGRLIIRQVSTGQDLAESEIGLTNLLKQVVWLTPDSLVWLGSDSWLRWMRQQPDGHWTQTELVQVKGGASSLTALSENTLAWAQANDIWTLNLISNAPVLLFRVPADRLVDFLYSKATRAFLLHVNGKGGDSLWQLSPDYTAPGSLTRLASDAWIDRPQWVNGNSGGYAYLSRRPDSAMLTVKSTPGEPPIRLFTNGNALSFTASADGKQLFIEGITDNALAEELWKYDVSTESLQRLVACSPRPPRYAKPTIPAHEFITLPSGQKFELYLYRPPNFDRHQHKKYPLVIGYTPFVATLGHMAQVCAPALANCGAYVVIIRRPGWDGRIAEWGEDVMACYNYLIQDASIDRERVFVFSRSREGNCLGELLAKHPEPWTGAMVLNGAFGRDLHIPADRKWPRLLFDCEDNPWLEHHLARFQQEALQQGLAVDCLLHKDAPHDFMAKKTLRERMRTVVNFVFNQ